MKIESLNRRIWGRLRDGHFPANGAKIHPSSFILHPCSSAGEGVIRFGNDEVVMGLSAVVGKIRELVFL